MPGRVESYDVALQVADVKPQLLRVARDEDGERVPEDLPVIPSVPVIFPGGGGHFITFPIATGDFGMLLFGEYAIDRWRVAGEAVDPGDERRHGLSGAVFLPGLRTRAGTNADADGTNLALGKEGGFVLHVAGNDLELPAGSIEFAARADRVLSELEKIVDAFNAHTHVTPSGTSEKPLPLLDAPLEPKSSRVKIT